MQIDEIKNKIQIFLTNSFRIKEIDDATDIFSTGLVHSLFFIQLLIFIEKTFAIELSPGEFEPTALNSINAISEMIQSKLAGENTA